MTKDDIVVELDRWREWYTTDPEAIAAIKRARDEIVALRQDRDTLFAAMDERGPAIRAEALVAIKNTIDLRLSNLLYEMQEGYDDSIVGFNDAWDVVREAFADAIRNHNQGGDEPA